MAPKKRRSGGIGGVEMWNGATYAVIIAVAVAAGITFNPPVVTKKIVFRKLQKVAGNYGNGVLPPKSATVLVGTNANVDLIVPAIDFLESAEENTPLPLDKTYGVNHESLESWSDVRETFAHFFDKGAAAERFVTKKELFDQVVRAAEKASSSSYRAGGNAALMANRFALDGFQVILSGQVSSQLSKHLEDRVSIASTVAEEQDSTHVILEYAKDASWGEIVSDRANRLILTPVKDVRPRDLNELKAAIVATDESAKPSLLVLSGLHLLERSVKVDWEDRLRRVADVMTEAKSRDIPVHLELASLANNDLTREMVFSKDAPLAQADSIGLNEQELAALFRAIGGDASKLPRSKKAAKSEAGAKRKKVSTTLLARALDRVEDLRSSVLKWRIVRAVTEKVASLIGLADSTDDATSVDHDDIADSDASVVDSVLASNDPDVTAVSHAVAHVLNTKQLGVSRVHFHTIGFHIVALRTESKAWDTRLTERSVARGSVRSTLQACNATSEKDLHGDDLDLPKGLMINVGTEEEPNRLEITRETVVLSYEIDGVTFFFAPVLVCKDPKVTVGLGDAISSSALGAYFN
eukprot:g1835.t1